jgi:hypothetical protein
MNPIKKIFFKKRGREQRVIAEVNMTEIHYMHVWNYHNKAHLYNYYMLIRKNILH